MPMMTHTPTHGTDDSQEHTGYIPWSGVYLEQVDFDTMFAQLSIVPEIANYYDVQTEEGKQKLNEMIFTHYEGNHLSMVPKCNCGHLNTSAEEYQICEICGHQCLVTTEKPIESYLWIETPPGVSGFVAPNFWHMLKTSTVVKERGQKPFEPIKWLTDPTYQVPNTDNKALERMLAVGLPRGRYNDFIDRFDDYYKAMLKARIVGTAAIPADELTEYIYLNRDKLFPQHLPLPSALNFPTEKTANRTYGNIAMSDINDAVQTISSIHNNQKPLSQNSIFHRVAKTIDMLSGFYVNWWSKDLAPKPGVARKHMYGSRLHFTFRAVISSLTEPHMYNELHLPWTLSLEVFSVHLKNLLMRRFGYTADQCQELLMRGAYNPTPLLKHLLNEIISSHPEGGWPVLFSRNPVLVRGSVAYLIVAKIKDNPSDPTISVPPETLSAPNADFDGDQMNGMIILDLYTSSKLRVLSPAYYVADIETPRQLSNFIQLPVPTCQTLRNWARRKPGEPVLDFSPR